MAVAAVVLVQGAGVSQGASNPDGRRSDPSRDVLAQGVANVASGIVLDSTRRASDAPPPGWSPTARRRRRLSSG